MNRLALDECGLTGFNGRPNKPVDTCYSFWVGAALAILRPFGENEQNLARSERELKKSQDFPLCLGV